MTMDRRRRIPEATPRLSMLKLAVLLVSSVGARTTAFAFAWTTARPEVAQSLSAFRRHSSRYRLRGDPTTTPARRLPPPHSPLRAIVAEAASAAQLIDYAPAAASLFNNMKLPAAVVTAGMISLGFATRFPKLPRDTLDRVYPPEVRRLCAKLDRVHIVFGLISVTSELIVVLWAAVEVNQLTERAYPPTTTVWELIHQECDLAWSAVNSHFILGIIGFVAMLWLRAYVMLLAARASKKLMIAASTGTAAALCLMVSIVNRGVEAGGGNSDDSYGQSILDLFQHYASLLLQAAMNPDSPGPLQLSAMILEITSLSFLFVVLLQESDASFEEQMYEKDSCPIDLDDIINNEEEVAKLSPEELTKLETCVALEEEQSWRGDLSAPYNGEGQKADEMIDTSVNIL